MEAAHLPTIAVTSSLHPPSIVHVSPGCSPFISSSSATAHYQPDDTSPLSSAPNSPVPSSDDDDEVRHLDEMLLEQQHLLRIPALTLQRKNSELGRESRKTRLRASLLARTGNTSSSTPEGGKNDHTESRNNSSSSSEGDELLGRGSSQHSRSGIDVLSASIVRPTTNATGATCTPDIMKMEEDEDNEPPLLPNRKVTSSPFEYCYQHEDEDSPLDEVDELLGNFCVVQDEDDEGVEVQQQPQQMYTLGARWNPQHCPDIGTSPVEIRKRTIADYPLTQDLVTTEEDEWMTQKPPLANAQHSNRWNPRRQQQQQRQFENDSEVRLAPSYDEAHGLSCCEVDDEDTEEETGSTSREEDSEVYYELQHNSSPSSFCQPLLNRSHGEIESRSALREPISSSDADSSAQSPPPRSFGKHQPEDLELRAVPTDESLNRHSSNNKLIARHTNTISITEDDDDNEEPLLDAMKIAPTLTTPRQARHFNVIGMEKSDEPVLGDVAVVQTVQDDEVPMDEILLDLSSATHHSASDHSFASIGGQLARSSSLLTTTNRGLESVEATEGLTVKPSASSEKFTQPGSDAAHAITVEDVKAIAVSDDRPPPVPFDEKSPLDLSGTSSESSSGPIGPMVRFEQHRPLLLQPDDVSSSDETLMATNGSKCGLTGSSRRRNRKNRVYGEANLHDYWRRQHPRRSKGKARKAEVEAGGSPDRLLPPLVVDQDQLLSIGVKAMIAVCNGIGSLFLSNQDTTESLKQRRPLPVEIYKKLAPENTKTKHGKRHFDDSKIHSVENDGWSHEFPSQSLTNATESNPVYFEESLRSIDSELSDENAGQLFAAFDAVTKGTSTGSQATLLAKSKQHESLDKQLPIKRTLSLPVKSTHSQQTFNGGWWIEDEITFRLDSKKIADTQGNASVSTAITGDVSSLVYSEADAPQEKGWSLAREIEKSANRKPRSTTGVAERIAEVPRKSRSKQKTESNPSLPVHSGEGPVNLLVSPGATDWSDLQKDSRPSARSAVDRHSEEHPEFTSPDKTAATVSATPYLDRRTSVQSSSAASTPGVMAPPEPPQLRRINLSLDLEESFMCEFASEIFDDDEPPSLSRSIGIDTKKSPSSCDSQKSPAERSPMSDFLVSRLQTNKVNMIIEGTPDTDANEERTLSPDHSDCSSTSELLTNLSVLVEDLDSLASARRIKRSLTSDPRSTDAQWFSDSVVMESVAELKMVSPESIEHLPVKHTGMPVLVDFLNSDIGIPKGDVMISLLNNEHMNSAAWVSRVDEAIWRCRTLRRNCDSRWLEELTLRKNGSPSHGRTSVCVDVDDVRVVGGTDKIADTQKAAMEHLKYDDFDDALALYEDVSWSYEQCAEGKADELMKYVAAAQYNLGIIHLLKAEHEEALEYFEHSTELLANCQGTGHGDHIVSILLFIYIAHFLLGSLRLYVFFSLTGIIGENCYVSIRTGRLLDGLS